MSDWVVKHRQSIEALARKQGLSVRTIWTAVEDEMTNARITNEDRDVVANAKFERILYAILRERGRAIDVY